MLRPAMIALLLTAAACDDSTPPPETVSQAPALFRGSQSEVRFRCGSEQLRARLRQGQILAQVGEGEHRVLVPVEDPRARTGQAYSDGKLTLYKLPDSQSWALANGASGVAECRHEPARD